MKKEWIMLIGQITCLTAVYQLSVFLVSFFHLPVPATVLGMAMLLFLFSKGLVQIRFVEKGALFLTKHLGFFFIPIAVSLMSYGKLFQSNGLAFTVMIAGSSLIGLAVTAGISDCLSQKRRFRK